MVITLLASAGAVAWLEDRSGTICATMIGAALFLLAVTVGKLVMDGSIFDDRGFHRTRPGGERMALRRLNRILAGLVIAIAAMPAVRCWIYNLGWESATWAAVLALVPAAWFTTAVATGVNLSLQGKSSVRTVILVLVGVPVGLMLLTMIVPYTGRWIIPVFLVRWIDIPKWTDTLTWAVALGAAGCGIAWWLASRWRQSKTALLIAGLTGILIQLHLTKYPLVPTRDLPASGVKIERLPPRIQDRRQKA